MNLGSAVLRPIAIGFGIVTVLYFRDGNMYQYLYSSI